MLKFIGFLTVAWFLIHFGIIQTVLIWTSGILLFLASVL